MTHRPCLTICFSGSTGVIYCTDRAIANGFSYADSHSWSNLGQGAPEVGPFPGAPEKPTSIPLPTDSLEYAPTTGVKGDVIFHGVFRFVGGKKLTSCTALREAVAKLYNQTYRVGKASQYTYENVCGNSPGRSTVTERLAGLHRPRRKSRFISSGCCRWRCLLRR